MPEDMVAPSDNQQDFSPRKWQPRASTEKNVMNNAGRQKKRMPMAERRKTPAKKEDAEMAARRRDAGQKRGCRNGSAAKKTPAIRGGCRNGSAAKKTPAKREDELVQFMEHHLDEGMKEVLVYYLTLTDGPRRPRGSSDVVEVDLAGSHSRLALGTRVP